MDNLLTAPALERIMPLSDTELPAAMHSLDAAKHYLTEASGKPPGDRLTLMNRAVAAMTRVIRNSFDAPALGLDLDGTLDDGQLFFSILATFWPGKIYIITYRSDHAKAVAAVQALGIRYDEVILAPTLAAKADIIKRLGVKIYVDDMDEVIMHIPDDVIVLKMRNGGNFASGKWLYSDQTGRKI